MGFNDIDAIQNVPGTMKLLQGHLRLCFSVNSFASFVESIESIYYLTILIINNDYSSRSTFSQR